MLETERAEIAAVVGPYGLREGEWSATPIEVGLINRTYRLDARGTPRILQRLHPIFAPSVNDDIDAITSHLERRGLATPRIVPTTDGCRWVVDASGATWRMLTFLDGRVFTKVAEPWVARGAGAMAGRFHNAVSDLDHEFKFTRAGVHDTPAHLARLERSLDEHRDHRSFGDVAPLARDILAHAASLTPLPEAPTRIIHGDLKLSNVMFRESEPEPLALLDLDTMARSTIAVEMGDAFRSWCNPAGENDASARVDIEIFGEAAQAYAASVGPLLTSEEIASLVVATETIALELAARFCADALYESYFGWDPKRFASRSEHNRVRASSQLAVARSARAQRSQLESIVRSAFART